MPDAERLRRALVGRGLPGGTFSVADYERYLSHDAMLAPPLPEGTLHPVWILLGALRGMGASTEQIMHLAEPGPHDRTLFGETSLEQREPLRTGVVYTVSGVVTEFTRREGRRAGTMDRLTVELTLVDPGGGVCAVSSQTFLVLRRSPDVS